MRSIIYKAGVKVDILNESKGVNGDFEFRCSIKPASRTPMPHYHQAFDESIYGEK